MKKIDNIKLMWSRMLKETQQNTVECLKKEYGLGSTVYVRQTWIWGSAIPKEYEDGVIEIFQNALREQEKKTFDLIG